MSDEPGLASRARATSFSFDTGVFCPHWSDTLDTEYPCDAACTACARKQRQKAESPGTSFEARGCLGVAMLVAKSLIVRAA